MRLGPALAVSLVLLSPLAVGAVPYRLHASSLYLAAWAAFSAYLVFKRPWSPGLKNFLILAGSCCLTATAADAVLRLAGRDLLYYRPHEMFLRRVPSRPELHRYAREVSYQGETFGDLAAMSADRRYRERRSVSFATDSLGFRNAPGAAGSPSNLVVLGDSFAAGNGTAQDRIFPSLLNERAGLAVYNLSIMSGPWEQLVNLKLELENLEIEEGSRLLWTIFTGNDLDAHYGDASEIPPARGLPRRALVSLEEYRNRSAIRQLLGRLADGLLKRGSGGLNHVRELPDGRTVLFHNPYVHAARRSAREVREHPNFAGLREVFAEMERFARSKGLEVSVVLAPTKSEVYAWLLEGEEPWAGGAKPSGFSEVLAELSAERGFRFLDLEPDFVEEGKRLYEESGDILWWRDDSHWNERGHAAAAAAVHRRLLSAEPKG